MQQINWVNYTNISTITKFFSLLIQLRDLAFDNGFPHLASYKRRRFQLKLKHDLCKLDSRILNLMAV